MYGRHKLVGLSARDEALEPDMGESVSIIKRSSGTPATRTQILSFFKSQNSGKADKPNMSSRFAKAAPELNNA